MPYWPQSPPSSRTRNTTPPELHAPRPNSTQPATSVYPRDLHSSPPRRYSDLSVSICVHRWLIPLLEPNSLPLILCVLCVSVVNPHFRFIPLQSIASTREPYSPRSPRASGTRSELP